MVKIVIDIKEQMEEYSWTCLVLYLCFTISLQPFFKLLLNCVIYHHHNRYRSCDSHAGYNIAYDFNHDISVALPLDSCPHLHLLIIDCGMHLLLLCTLQS